MDQDYKNFVERMGSFDMELDFDKDYKSINRDKNQNELVHYGILGMKWGVRRFQRKDGSLTSAGKRRKKTNISSMSDEELKTKTKRINLEKAYTKATRSTKLEDTKKLVDSSANLANQTKSITQRRSKTESKKFDLSNSSDQELRDKINRANLERQYNDLFGAQEVSKGRQYATNVLEGAGDALVITGSVLGVALAIKELRK